MFDLRQISRLVRSSLLGLALAACAVGGDDGGGAVDLPVVGVTSAALSADGATSPTQFADETRVRLQIPRARAVLVDDGFTFAAGCTVRVDVYGRADERRIGLLESFETILDVEDVVPGAVPVDLPRSFDDIDVELEVTVTDGGGRSEVNALVVPSGTAGRLPQRSCPHFAEIRQRVPSGQLVPSEKVLDEEVER